MPPLEVCRESGEARGEELRAVERPLVAVGVRGRRGFSLVLEVWGCGRGRGGGGEGRGYLLDAVWFRDGVNGGED